MIRIGLIFTLLVASLALAGGDISHSERRLHRRSGVEPLLIDQLEVLPEGVRVRAVVDGLMREQTVSWAMISSVDPMANNLMEPGLVEGLRNGEDLWRGRSRLLRGDSRLALLPLQKAWSRLAGEGSVTEAFAAEGVLRSALLQGRPHVGVVPGLRCMVLANQGILTDRFLDLGPVLDPELGLIPNIPPVLNEADTQRVVTELDEMISEMAVPSPYLLVFRSLLLREAPSPRDTSKREKPGIEFLRLLAELDSTDPLRRERARTRLLSSLSAATGWRESWVHFFVGRSLVEYETDPTLRLVGVLELLHVPPLKGVAPPGLISRALSLSSQTLRELGQDEYADIIESHAEPSGVAGIEENRP